MGNRIEKVAPTARDAWDQVANLERRMDRLDRAYQSSYDLAFPDDRRRMVAIEEAQLRLGSTLRLMMRAAQSLEAAEIWPNGLPAHP